MSECLFEKYGGMPLLNTIVEDFYAKAVSHEKLKQYFAGHDMERLKNHQAAFLAVAMGAPSSLYTGRGMRESHHHLRITAEAFDAMMAIFESALRAGGIEEQDIPGMLTTLQRHRSEVVAE